MPGHLWKVVDSEGNHYFVITKRDSEDAARTLFHKELGHRVKVETVKYMSFVHAVQE